MAKCTKCGSKAGFMMSICETCLRASRAELGLANFDSGSVEKELPSDNIGYLLGWFCWFLPVALIIAIFYLYKRRWREAFQAVAILIIFAICINIAQLMSRGTNPGNSIALNIMTVIAVPLFAVMLLQSIGWPSSRASYEHGINNTDGVVRPNKSANDSNDIVCPKCKFEQWTGYEKCQKCGVTFQKN